jgi:dTDP-4-dehydrorhamnose 3,5-epimerase-like enzyme
MDYKIEHFEKHDDKRGQLVIFLKNSDLNPNFKNFGQIYFVTFEKENVIRGNHYHENWREWFGVVFGKLEVVLKDVNSGETKKLILDGNSHEYIRLEIGPYVAHAFKNISPKAALLNYANREWSPDDTFHLELMR